MADPNAQPNSYEIGQHVTFTGYSTDNPDGQFQPGAELIIKSAGENGGFFCTSPDGAIEEHLFEDDEFKPLVPAKPSRSKAAKPEKAAKPAAEAKAPAVKGGAKAATAKAEKAAAKAKEDEAAAKAQAKAQAAAAKEAEKAERARIKEEQAAARAAEKAEREKPVEVVDTERLTEILSEHSNNALDAARALLDQVEESYFSLGGVLAHINYNAEYRKLGEEFQGPDGFEKYCERYLSMSKRTAQYHIAIYAYYTGLGMTEADLTGIGWAKSKELVQLTENKDKAIEYLEFAKDHTVSEVRDYAKEVKRTTTTTTTTKGGEEGTGSGPERIKLESFKFRFAGEEAELVHSAINRAKEITPDASENGALLQIVTEWAASVDGGEITLEQYIAAAQNRFGVTLVVEGEETAEAA